MKKLIVLFVLIATGLMINVSCNKVSQVAPTNDKFITKKTRQVNYHIYYSTWTEWGRKSKNCAGWGLCNFSDCWFCCTDGNGNVIDCPKDELIANSGIIYIPEGANSGFMEIKLKPAYEDQSNAIQNQLTLDIDEDIIGERFVLHQGGYLFNSTIGMHGGYRVLVSKK
jgi:hypothetical protein